VVMAMLEFTPGIFCRIGAYSASAFRPGIIIVENLRCRFRPNCSILDIRSEFSELSLKPDWQEA